MIVTQKTTQNERIRGPNLTMFIHTVPGLPFEEALARANADNRVLASNSRLSKAFPETKQWRSIQDAIPCWSGTMTAYLEPGEKLGKQIEYIDPDTGYKWVFPVPEVHSGKKDVVLVVEHPDYSLEIDGNNRVIHAKTIDLVENFPADEGWYRGDPKYDIPTGRQIEHSGIARYLWRTDRCVGPVCSNFYDDDLEGQQDVDIKGRVSYYEMGVVVESLFSVSENDSNIILQERLEEARRKLRKQ